MKSFRLRVIPLRIAELSTILLLSTGVPPFDAAQAQSPAVTGSKARGHPPRIVEPAANRVATAKCPESQYLTGFELRSSIQTDTIEPICVAAAAIAPLSTSDTVASANIDVQRAGVVRVAADWFREQPGKVVRVACPPTKPFVVALWMERKDSASSAPHHLTIFCDLPAQPEKEDEQDNYMGSFEIQDLMSRYNQAESLASSVSKKAESLGLRRDSLSSSASSSACPTGKLATGVNGTSRASTDRISGFDLTCAPLSHVQLRESGASEVADLRLPAKVAERATERRVFPPDSWGGALMGTRIGADVSRNPQVPEAGAAPVDLCDAARRARERNSPATAGLEAQCAAYTARVQPVRTEQEIADMAARGAVIGLDDPAIMSMRERFGGGADARAFDVGLAAAERQTEWGPGKQRLALSFDPGPRHAYMAAVEYTLDRNRNAERAAIGSQIAQADPELAETRTKNADPRFWLGFDIATAIFGDPSLGAQGNTALGPGSLGVRAALSELSKQGFDSATKLHLSRTYGE